MNALTWIDYTIIGILALSSIISLIRGFVREALSLASWVAAFWVALSFSSILETYFQAYVQSASVRYALAFVILFIATLIVGAVVNFTLTQLMEKTGLSGTDRLLGVLFGFARGVLLIAVVLLAAQMTDVPKQQIWLQSKLVPVFAPVEDWLSSFVPRNIESELPTNAVVQAENAVGAKIRKATSDSQMLQAAANSAAGVNS